MQRATRFLLPMLTVALGCGSPSDLTNAQITAAIRRADLHNGDDVFRPIYRQAVQIKRGSETIYVLSASGRIAVAAYLAKQQRKPELTVQDASAMALGMVAVVLVSTERRSFEGISRHTVALKADDKTIQPVSGIPERYNLGVPGVARDGVQKRAFSSTFLFSAIEGAQKVSVILTIGAGQRIEKEADPRLFQLR